MAITSDAIGLLFRAKGDTDDAKKAFSDLRSHVTNDIDAIDGKGKSGFASLAQSMGVSENSVRSLSGALPGLAMGFTAIASVMAVQVAVAVQAVTGLYNLAKSASEAGSEIKDMQDKTGLAAATLSTLKLSAENAGSSFEQVGSGITKFAKLLGEASAGNEKAQATLKALNVSTTDLDEGLKEVIKSIANAKEGTEQITLAQKAFGKAGADLIPVIKQMNGDLEAAQKEAERLGTTLTDSSTKAADEFGDALGILSSQVSTAANRFALEFAPEITKAIGAVSNFLANNQDVAYEWGRAIADVVRGVVGTFTFVKNAVVGVLDYLGFKFDSSASQARAWANALLFAISPVLMLAQKLGAMFAKNTPAESQEGGGFAGASASIPMPTGGGKGGGKGGGGGSEKNEAERQEKADLDAKINLQKLYLKELKDSYKTTLEEIRAEFKKTGDDVAFATAANASNAKFAQDAQGIITLLQQFETQKAALDGESQAQADLRKAKQQQDIDDINDYKLDELNKNNKLLEESDQKLADAGIKITKDAIAKREKIERDSLENWRKNEKAKYDAEIKNGNSVLDNIVAVTAFLRTQYESDLENKLITIAAERDARKEQIEETIKNETAKREALAEADALYDAQKLEAYRLLKEQLAAIDEEYMVPVNAGADEKDSGFLGGLNDGALVKLETNANGAINIFKTLGNTVGAVTRGMAQGIGSMIQQWVLYGSAGPHALRKMTAALLANLAAQAAVESLMELARGFAKLANPFTAWQAPFHFKAAALFAGVAGVAAVAGRMIAGDVFKQQSTGERAFASTAGESTGSGNAGGVYSSNKDQVIEKGRNTPGGIRQEIVVSFRDKSDWFAQMFKIEMEKNGMVRQLVLDAA